jgi:hypothetical protein
MSSSLGRGVAIALRVGTAVAVAGIGLGYLVAALDGSTGPGPTPAIDLLRGGGGDALIGVGLIVLTLTPPAALVVAAVSLWRMGERSRAVTAGAVIGLLAASLAVAVAIGAAS